MPRRVTDLNNMKLNPADFAPDEGGEKKREIHYSRDTFRVLVHSFCENKLAMFCAALLVLIIIGALCAPLSPHDPDTMDLANKMAAPGNGHILGTDEMGRDSFTRVLYGGRVSLAVGFMAMLVSVFVGTLVGVVSGYAGGRTDAVLMRVVDAFLSVPNLLLIIVIYAFVPPTMATLVFMLALFSWTGVARIVRAQTLSLKERDFVLAARSLGVSHAVIIFKHMLPNMASQIIVAASLSIAQAILDESALSFLGYGIQLPASSWGSMLQSAQKYILYDPLLAVIPGVFILATVLCFNVLGDVLQHALDPRLAK